uniref:RNase H type-1 domain-containing protein n=1 Tax=Cannabis sativa TaxID=3483 RepID=A0A803Q194_CANSA
MALANTTLHQWRKAQYKDNIPSCDLQQSGDGMELWAKPVDSVIKVNVDAAIFEGEGPYGFGMVDRYCTGQLLQACCQSFPGHLDVPAVEAMGVKEALSWIQDKQWHHVEVETDGKLTVQVFANRVAHFVAR